MENSLSAISATLDAEWVCHLGGEDLLAGIRVLQSIARGAKHSPDSCAHVNIF